MPNSFYNNTSTPQPNSAGSSSLIRAEFASIAAGFNKLPTLLGNENKVVVINSSGTGMEGATSLSGLTLTGSAFNGTVGGTTPSTGAFTSLAASGQITSTVSTGTAPLVIASTTKVTNLNADLLDGGDWAAPGAIGLTTPSTGAFTTVTASTQFSGPGTGLTGTASSLTAGTASATVAAVTFNNGGAGDASGTSFSGGTARTISYNTVGAAASGHVHGNITNAGAIGSTADLPIKTTTSGVLAAGAWGTTAGTFCQGNDSRLSDARTPTAHTHGNITNAGAIGATANLPVITTTSGVLTTGSFGSGANTFCQGNDSRLSDARTPTAHAVNASTYGYGDATNAGHLRVGSGLSVTTGTVSLDLTADQTWSGSQRGTVTTDNDLSFDMAGSNNFSCTPTAGGTLTFTNITAGQSGFILLVNNSNYAIAAAATTKVESTTLSKISATGTYLLSYFSNGTNVYVSASGAMA